MQLLRLVRPDETAAEQEMNDVGASLAGETSNSGEHRADVGKARKVSASAQPLPDLYISCFGRFEVRRGEAASAPLDLCSNAKGQAILRYLLTRSQRRASVDKLLS